jgi:predicted SPOUT superfamily RNA methylase MTH1
MLSEADIDSLDAEAVDPSAPREEAGYYWGYTTRRCSSLSAVFTECPFDGGYDYSIGTSERGIAVSSLTAIPPVTANGNGSSAPAAAAPLPKFQHLILVFGGVAGLEAAVAFDTEFEARGITKDKANEVFDAWVNLVPGQGSRTIRTEEAVWVGLMGLRELVMQNGSDGVLCGKTSGIRLLGKQK